MSSHLPHTLSDFDFSVPEELIAYEPLPDRTQSRLLHLNQGKLSDHVFSDLLSFLHAGDVLVMNDTKVLPARLVGKKASSGGQVEVFLERLLSDQEASVQLGSSKPIQKGQVIDIAPGVSLEVLEREGRFFKVQFNTQALCVFKEHGTIPLPPYIKRQANQADISRYQTVYAHHDGSVAAPTAGLHFNESLLSDLKQKGVVLAYVTLHVGAGTFLPIRVHDLSDHRMHEERWQIDAETADQINWAKNAGSRVVSVGTTTVRALESAAQNGIFEAGSGKTDLFIKPGFKFKMIDGLITNFHQPQSSLFVMVSSLVGLTCLRQAYQHAIDERYRFYSYGDAMLILTS